MREPDVLAIQEAVWPQVSELRKALPEYGVVGVGGQDGARAGEFVPVFYRKARFTLTDQGHFWLSETPSRPGSVGWDAAAPRVVTWATLRFNDLPWRSVRIVNVHLDPQGERARIESAKLLRRTVESLGGQPLLVVGDFNCTPGSSPYRILTEQKGNLTALRDAHATGPALPSRVSYASVGSGTYHGFSGQAYGGRIDWILFNRQFDAVKAEIDRERVDGRYPSDHFPVIAEVRLRVQSGST